MIDSQQLRVLQIGAVVAAVWSCIFSCIQIGIMGWQMKVVKALQWELENRQVPIPSGSDPFRARFPGLYARYTETPERQRINALFVIALVNLILTIVHLVLSIVLLYGTVKKQSNCIWPWFLTVVASIIMSTTYAVIWWSGDVFNEQLTMTYVEFLMAIPVNSIALGWVVFYYVRLFRIANSNENGKKNRKPRNIVSSTGKEPLVQLQRPNPNQQSQWNGQRNAPPQPHSSAQPLFPRQPQHSQPNPYHQSQQKPLPRTSHNPIVTRNIQPHHQLQSTAMPSQPKKPTHQAHLTWNCTQQHPQSTIIRQQQTQSTEYQQTTAIRPQQQPPIYHQKVPLLRQSQPQQLRTSPQYLPPTKACNGHRSAPGRSWQAVHRPPQQKNVKS